ncbi:MAG: aldose 1-epimerase family protein [Clostridia bacterium]|nr:aldose 1-epimerase family protein [Clostridia bacterium]
MEKLYRSGYLCHPMQAYTLRRVTVEEGKARGVQVIEIATAGGLQVDLLPDSGLDIGQVRYRGVNMSWVSKNGPDAPYCDNPFENEFLKYFPGGLLYTGGMRSAGPGNRDGDEWHPLHGRYHGMSAEQVCARMEDDVIVVSGVLRETALFGHNLEMKREYRIPVFGAKIQLADTLTNLAHQSEEYALLYHCNFGWPLVSEKAHVELPVDRRTTPRTPFAATALGREHTFTAPVPGEEERVFFHEDMEKKVSIVNPDIDTRMTISWSDTLPVLSHWRSMASGDYVCGLEPTNCYIMGRSDERKNGTLPVLEPFASVSTGVCIEFGPAK